MDMHLIHLSTIKQTDGTIDIDIYIVNGLTIKPYSYSLTSQYDVELFHQYYKRGKGFHRSALTVLEQYKMTREQKLEKIIASNAYPLFPNWKLGHQYLLEL
jgi:hypothetical protein